MTTTSATSPVRKPAADPAQDALIAQWSRGGGEPRPAPAGDTPLSRAAASAPSAPARTSSGAGRQITIGVLLLATGVLVTSLTYSAAEGGGTYVLAWGPIVYGLISLVRGLAALGRD